MELLLILFGLLILLELSILVYYIRRLKFSEEALDYYRSRLLKMVANDTLVKESFEIICEAYQVEEGDLRNYISQYQRKKGESNEPQRSDGVLK